MRFSGRLARLQALMVSGGIFSRAKRCCPISMSSVTWWVHYYTQRISVLWAIFLRMCSLCFLQLWHDICVWHVTCVFACMTCRECHYVMSEVMMHFVTSFVMSYLGMSSLCCASSLGMSCLSLSVLGVFVWYVISLLRVISLNVTSCLCYASLASLLRVFGMSCVSRVSLLRVLCLE